MFNDNTNNPILINCVFSGNLADSRGGAIFNGVSHPLLINCSLAGNTAGIEGEALLNAYISSTSLTNCIIWNNGGQNAFANDNGSSVTASYCLIEPGETNYSGSNNLTTDPKFVDANNNNLRLKAGSPTINTGDNAAYSSANGPTTDLAGRPRIQGGTIDRGASS